MDGIFGVIDDNFKVSIVDSTMMWIVHRAMDKAHERVKSGEGVIERLHEISKFYELSVMQLDGCIKFVEEETDSHNPESSHEEVLAGLAEIRNRLQRRLYESELAILQKDRELADRFVSESKLRQALEFTEKELVSSQEDLEQARSRSAGSSNLSPHEGEDDNRDGEFCELKDSVDRQVWKIREKLEFDDYVPKVKNRRNHCINDLKVEEMGSDIDILKETLDIAFGKMQSAIFCSDMGPIEQQVKSSIENDIISLCLNGFVRDCQEDLEAEARRKENQVSVSFNEHWSYLMNEAIGLCEELKPLISQNEIQPQKEDLDGRFSEYGINKDENELEEEGRHDVAKMVKNQAEELVHLKPEMLREESPESLKSRFREVLEKLENLKILNARINKILGQNWDFDEEDIPPEDGEQIFTENHRQKSDVGTLADIWGKMHQLRNEENRGIQNQICMLTHQREDIKFQNIMMEEIFTTLFRGVREKFCNDLSRWELEILISDGICRIFIRDMFNQLDETMESYKIEAQIKDDIYHIFFMEAMKGYRLQDVKDENLYLEGLTSDNNPSRCLECETKQEIYGIPFTVMLEEWHRNIIEHTSEILLREEISWFVLSEKIKSICYKANHCPHTKFFNDFLPQITIKEDVCSVFLREMVTEWEDTIEVSNLETLIREEIYWTMLDEAKSEVCDRERNIDVPTQDSDVTEITSSRKTLGEGTEIGPGSLCQKLSLLSEGIEVVENLVLSASLEIMDCNSKATSVELKDIQCVLNSLSNKLEKTMMQFNNKLFVGELKPSLETIVDEAEKISEISPDLENVPDTKFLLSELHNIKLSKSDSKCLKLLEFPHIFYDFELMANKKLGQLTLRLEEMKHTLYPLPQVMASLRESESLYKKAFIRRCQNLRKAENEVDLLGDQVDILLRLIEKVYLILNQQSPVLQQYSDVSEILRLIKEQVAVLSTPPKKLDTSSDV
ncbi:WPP domain-associated protein, partial [Cucurbita argyrosperma subsp. argyrosperma]